VALTPALIVTRRGDTGAAHANTAGGAHDSPEESDIPLIALLAVVLWKQFNTL
jgi:hypothetical protein